MSTAITLVQGQQAEFALPLSQGTLSAVTLTLSGAGAVTLGGGGGMSVGEFSYGPNAGTLQTSDGINTRYLWPDTSTLAVRSYTYSFAWALGGVTQTPLTGTLSVVPVSAAPTADYTAWPTANDVLSRLASAAITLRDGVVAARMSTVLMDVAAEVSRRTLRQFIADPTDTTRYYDGNDCPWLIVDEMVSLTSVQVLTYPSPLSLLVNPDLAPTTPVPYVLDDAALVFEQGKPMTRIVAERVSSPDYSGRYPGSYGYTGGNSGDYLNNTLYPSTASQHKFSIGRQNITVTGKFGFGLTVPADLWAAVCGEMASRLAAEALFLTDGRVNAWKGGDESFTLTLADVSKMGWHDAFEASVAVYTRPAASRNRLTLV